jgi:hypothetical protein
MFLYSRELCIPHKHEVRITRYSFKKYPAQYLDLITPFEVNEVCTSVGTSSMFNS